ncbi:MAG: hypothetical protein Q9214_005751 [Letrouitia sp. 1 TL-2023]
MCLCFKRSKRNAPLVDYYPPVPIERPLDVSDDGLSKAFQSLSIHSAPYPSAKTTVSTRSVAQPPSPPIKSAPSITPSVAKPPSLPTKESTSSVTPSSAEKGGKIPIFPVPSAPQCRRCHWIPKRREIVSISNPNGNAGRPYYICIKCKQYNNNNNYSSSSTQQYVSAKISQLRRREKDGWIAWDDNIGIEVTNRPCYCGFVCRQDKAGVNSWYPGGGFWTCAIGNCDFLSFRRDALQEWEARERGLPTDERFEPWLL